MNSRTTRLPSRVCTNSASTSWHLSTQNQLVLNRANDKGILHLEHLSPELLLLGFVLNVVHGQQVFPKRAMHNCMGHRTLVRVVKAEGASAHDNHVTIHMRSHRSQALLHRRHDSLPPLTLYTIQHALQPLLRALLIRVTTARYREQRGLLPIEVT